jgi:UV DNA damage endonuclease
MQLPVSPYAAINIHGAKSNRTQELISVINDLPDNIRKRLTLENDESAYSAVDLLEVSQSTKVPVVFDSHHHVFNTGELSMEEAIVATMKSWPTDIKPLQHISNTDPSLVNGSFTERRKHSNLIHYIPEEQLHHIRSGSIDIEVEAKLKNFAIEKMLQDFSLVL